MGWEFAHTCVGGWTEIRGTIRHDSMKALHSWAAARNITLPTYQAGDVVIQSRCAPDTILDHDDYGPAAFSYYDAIAGEATPPGAVRRRRITILYDPTMKYAPCDTIHQELVKHLKTKYPDTDVAVGGGTAFDDWYQLSAAPLVFKDSTSSYGLWAALASSGQVWSAPLRLWGLGPSTSGKEATPYLGAGWHWVHNKVLYPHVAEALGWPKTTPGHDGKLKFNATAMLPQMIDWLKTH